MKHGCFIAFSAHPRILRQGSGNVRTSATWHFIQRESQSMSQTMGQREVRLSDEFSSVFDDPWSVNQYGLRRCWSHSSVSPPNRSRKTCQSESAEFGVLRSSQFFQNVNPTFERCFLDKWNSTSDQMLKGRQILTANIVNFWWNTTFKMKRSASSHFWPFEFPKSWPNFKRPSHFDSEYCEPLMEHHV